VADEPDVVKCDFCSKPDPEWVFPCRSFVLRMHNETIAERGLSVDRSGDRGFSGDWLACEDCMKTIQEGGIGRLTVRIIRLYERVDPTLADPTLRSKLARELRRMYDMFERNRTGKPVQRRKAEG
jgi:hypothetical protein